MNKKRGFTLIELLVVVAIIGLLSTVVLGSVQDARIKAQDKSLLSSAIQLRNALELYRADHNGLYPGEPDVVFYNEGSRFSGVFSQQSYSDTGGYGGLNLASILSPYLKGNIIDPIHPDSYFYYYHDGDMKCEGQTTVPRYVFMIQPKSDLGLPGYESYGSVYTDFVCMSAPN